ncbi:Myb-like DNA-binding protein [Nitzschia inconspicua]|uniref:Myb-like DNA-binding protein n=1 Tax=Nitzschia inconspicua TaxID=303405 RepID=A0A9K3L3G9_9STRA|nr:Myb-like DNA-binding protein [Nitzschia inconspicua]
MRHKEKFENSQFFLTPAVEVGGFARGNVEAEGRPSLLLHFTPNNNKIACERRHRQPNKGVHRSQSLLLLGRHFMSDHIQSQSGGKHSSSSDSSGGNHPPQNTDDAMMAIMLAGIDTQKQVDSMSGSVSAVSSLHPTIRSISVPVGAAAHALVGSALEHQYCINCRSSNNTTHAAEQLEHQHHHCSTTTRSRLTVISRPEGDKNPNLKEDTHTRGRANSPHANASPAHSHFSQQEIGTFEKVLSKDHVVGTETEQEAITARPLMQKALTAQQCSLQPSPRPSSSEEEAAHVFPLSNSDILGDGNEAKQNQQRDHIIGPATSSLSPVTNSTFCPPPSTTHRSTALVAIAPKGATATHTTSYLPSRRPAVEFLAGSGEVACGSAISSQKKDQQASDAPSTTGSSTATVAATTSTPTTAVLTKIVPLKQDPHALGRDTAPTITSISSNNTAGTAADPPVTPEASNEDTKSLPNKGKRKRSFSGSLKSGQTSGRWTREEHQAFLEGLKECGREWKKVAMRIPTRTSAQIRSHAQKYFAKLQRDHDSSHHLLTASITGGGNSSHDESPAALVAGEGGLLTGITIATHPPNSLAPSIQRNVERIMADPRAAQQEVENTLEALRERYRQLQQRLDERRQRRRHRGGDVSVGSFSSENQGPPSVSAPVHVHNARLSRKRLFESPRQYHNSMTASGTGADENSSVSSNVSSVAASRGDLGNEEIIALQVLGGDLPRGDSSVEDAASVPGSAPIDLDEASAAHSTVESNAMDIDDHPAVPEYKTDDASRSSL